MIRPSDRTVLRLLSDPDAPILVAAREISAAIRERGADAAVVGGVAVFLHGHRRTTADVDLFTADPSHVRDLLESLGFEFNQSQRQFTRGEIIVQLVTPEQAFVREMRTEDIDGIIVASLPDLIAMKLRSGLAKTTRAQDLADVIALIRVRKLSNEFARQLPKELRNEFRKLVAAVGREAREE